MLIPPPVIKKKPSPSKREKRWVSIAIRAESYALLQQLCSNQEKSMGEVLMALISNAYHGQPEVNPRQEKDDVTEYPVPDQVRHRSRY